MKGPALYIYLVPQPSVMGCILKCPHDSHEHLSRSKVQRFCYCLSWKLIQTHIKSLAKCRPHHWWVINSIEWNWPICAAKWSGVALKLFSAFALAPCARRSSRIFSFSTDLKKFYWSTQSICVKSLPKTAATCNGVMPATPTVSNSICGKTLWYFSITIAWKSLTKWIEWKQICFY